MITIINGAPGSGKTNTAKMLFETTEKSAWIDGDWMLTVNPTNRSEELRRLRYKNIANIARNYYQSGFIHIFISFVYIKVEDLAEQNDLLKELDSIKVIALVPNEVTLRERHIKDTCDREEVESSINLNNKISNMEGMEKIDNSFMTVEQVCTHIKNSSGNI